MTGPQDATIEEEIMREWNFQFGSNRNALIGPHYQLPLIGPTANFRYLDPLPNSAMEWIIFI
jgi:hypothetical protein